MNSKYYRQRYLNGLSATPSNDNNGQFKATCYYTYNGKPNKHLILSGKIIGGTTDIMSESNQGETIQVTSPQITIIPYNTKLKVLGKSRNWTKVNYNGTQG